MMHFKVRTSWFYDFLGLDGKGARLFITNNTRGVFAVKLDCPAYELIKDGEKNEPNEREAGMCQTRQAVQKELAGKSLCQWLRPARSGPKSRNKVKKLNIDGKIRRKIRKKNKKSREKFPARIYVSKEKLYK